MSWDAYLADDRGHEEGDWNYTHNCNGMANIVMQEWPDASLYVERTAAWWDRRNRPELAERDRSEARISWWCALDGMDGPEGAAFLDRIIKELEADPERFREMNPPNGWGDFDSFVSVLRSMRDRVPEWPCTWSTSG